MGNTQPGSMLNRPTGALDSFIAELGGDIIYEKSLGSARFLKTVKCRHKNGPLVVKIFIKPDPGVALRTYHRRLKIERESLSETLNIYNFQSFVETDRAGYLIRQWIASNLYDRISTRPFLSGIEKKWIAFQVITALRDARHRKVSHGDIKSENILVTSWNWVYLSDFASFKPTYLPLDDPSEFSYFFDTSGRRTCYIAPERFFTATGNPDINAKKSKIAMDDSEGKRDGKLTEAMDCFSVGCVIAELFLEGAPLFTLSQLFKYREGEYTVDSHLNAIEDDGVRNMIKEMISLDPAARPTFETVLHTSRGTVFPESFFSFLHNYVASVNEIPSGPPFTSTAPTSALSPSVSTNPPTIVLRPTPGPNAVSEESPADTLPSDSDHRMERIWADYESVEPYLVPEEPEGMLSEVQTDEQSSTSVSKPFQDIIPVELYIPNRDSKLPVTSEIGRLTSREDGPSLIILALVTCNIRNCSLPSAKIRALDVLLSLSSHLTDEAKLDRMVPYIVDLLHDEIAIVRSAAFRTLIQVLMLVTVITPSNAAIFPEYILPNIRHLVQDSEVTVRCTYAQCIVQVAETAVRYLEMGQALKAHGTFKLAPEAYEYDQANVDVSYDARKQDLRNTIQEHLSSLLTDSSSVVKRAVLHNISFLCIFLGVQKTNDVLLSHMITYLNDRDWLLRFAFFDSIFDVATCARGRNLEEYILPLMIQALSDVEETVVAKVLGSLTRLCELDMFQKMRIWELMSATLGFLYHPNAWIRQGAVAFIASAANHLPASDVWCILYPSLRVYLKSDVVKIDKPSLLVALKPPLPRHLFDAGVQWAMKPEKGGFWKGGRRAGNKSEKGENARDSVISLKKSANNGPKMKTEEDEVQIARLRQLGMSPQEEAKLWAMRDYILKLANTIPSFAVRSSFETEAEKLLKTAGDVELPKLGVVPQTVFLKTRLAETSLPSSRVPTRKPSSEFSARNILSPPRGSRSDSNNVGAPFEDLRRRLATINGSTSSVGITQATRDFRVLPSPITTSFAASPAQNDLRPPSPTESLLSTTNSSTFRPLNRMQVGATDGQKAAPAVGSSKTNVAGFLDSHLKLRSEGSSEWSGRSSPTMMSNTLRPVVRHQSFALPISSYDGQEQGISNLLENLYLDNNRELQHDFGPKVREGPIRRRNPARQSFTSRDDGSRRLDANLIAHLTSHSDCINGLAVSPDHMFFVSCSDDKTVKVWDTARLERNVTSKPRHTYGQHHARVKCVCILEGAHCFASAAEDGSLHVVRVYTTQTTALPKYTKLQLVREYRVARNGEHITSMMHYNTESSSNLVYTTTHCMIVVLDLRSLQVLQTMENPRQHGSITCLCVDRKRSWILVGTSTGVLSLWDRRFGLRLKSWHVGLASTGRSVRIHHCILHPSKGRGKWVMVTVEAPKRDSRSTPISLVEVWDIENSVLMETFSTRTAATSDPTPEPDEVLAVDANSTPAAAIAALVRARQSDGKLPAIGTILPSPSPNVRIIAAGIDFGGHATSHRTEPVEQESHSRRGGFMICGSEDRKIRLWDLGRPEKSTILSGLDSDQSRPVYSALTNGTSSSYMETWSPSPGSASQSNRAPQRISLITQNQQNLLRSHQDVITSLICIDSPFRGGLVSGDRAGVIKVWRVEAAEQ
ncbi:hypothetical protein C8J56DRAFT_926236 [Mycena floridula]|nr:hypothetical protein C8J56DRAFT_926236 [Mycena floridula]